LIINFIQDKFVNEPETVVHQDKDGNDMTLRELFESSNIVYEQISSHTLDVQADHSTFQRFDRFNKKYNLMGQPLLREIFIKTENFIGGRFMAEITQQVINQL
jgi:AMP deaminase